MATCDLVFSDAMVVIRPLYSDGLKYRQEILIKKNTALNRVFCPAYFNFSLTLSSIFLQAEHRYSQEMRPAIGDDGDAAKRFGIRPAR